MSGMLEAIWRFARGRQWREQAAQTNDMSLALEELRRRLPERHCNTAPRVGSQGPDCGDREAGPRSGSPRQTTFSKRGARAIMPMEIHSRAARADQAI